MAQLLNVQSHPRPYFSLDSPSFFNSVKVILDNQFRYFISRCNFQPNNAPRIHINASMKTYTIRLKFIITVSMPYITETWVPIFSLPRRRCCLLSTFSGSISLRANLTSSLLNNMPEVVKYDHTLLLSKLDPLSYNSFCIISLTSLKLVLLPKNFNGKLKQNFGRKTKILEGHQKSWKKTK